MGLSRVELVAPECWFGEVQPIECYRGVPFASEATSSDVSQTDSFAGTASLSLGL